MALLKKWFRSSRETEDSENLEIEELVVLGRYDEAEDRLRMRLKLTPLDLRAQLLLADICLRTGRREEAAERYMITADGYAEDGFHDRAVALLSKTAKLLPGEKQIQQKIEEIREAKRREDRRVVAIRALLARHRAGRRDTGSSALEIEQMWNELESSPVLKAMDAEQVGRFFGAAELLRAQRGRILANEGDAFEAAFFILQGEVVAEVSIAAGRLKELQRYYDGDLLGERSLLERRPFPARYRATKDSFVLTFSRRALERILEGNPDPRGFLDALRAQGHDAKIAEMAETQREISEQST